MFSFRFFPKEYQFFDLFEQTADNLVLAARELEGLLDHYEELEHRVERIREFEHIGDQLTHQMFAQLYQAFVTPIDHQDIAALAERLDDVLDLIDDAAVNFRTYQIAVPTARAQELGRIILKSTILVRDAVHKLRNAHQRREITAICKDINQLENDADVVYRLARAELFAGAAVSPERVLDILKWREIYESLETASDRCEDVANVLEGIVLKYS